MGNIKTNRYSQAVSEIEKLHKDLLLKVSEEIDEKEKKLFHVLLVKIIDRPGEVTNVVTGKVQKYNRHGFDKIKKNYKFLGFNKLILLHDPALNPKEEAPKAVELKKVETKMSDADMEAEIERRATERANAIIASQKKEAPKEPLKEDGQGEGSTIADPFAKGDTIDMMKEFAKENDIDLSGLSKKDEIKATLITWYNDQLQDQDQQ